MHRRADVRGLPAIASQLKASAHQTCIIIGGGKTFRYTHWRTGAKGLAGGKKVIASPRRAGGLYAPAGCREATYDLQETYLLRDLRLHRQSRRISRSFADPAPGGIAFGAGTARSGSARRAGLGGARSWRGSSRESRLMGRGWSEIVGISWTALSDRR